MSPSPSPFPRPGPSPSPLPPPSSPESPPQPTAENIPNRMVTGNTKRIIRDLLQGAPRPLEGARAQEKGPRRKSPHTRSRLSSPPIGAKNQRQAHLHFTQREYFDRKGLGFR